MRVRSEQKRRSRSRTSGPMTGVMFPVLAILLATCPLAAMAGDVIFNDLGTVAAPTSYGHLTFGISADDLYFKYAERSWAIFDYFASNWGNGTQGCEDAYDPKDDRHGHHCSLFEVIADTNSSSRKTFLAEMREIAIVTRIISAEMKAMIFGKYGHRVKKSAALLALGGLEVISFGMTLKNTYDIAIFRQKMADLKSQMDSLIHLNDEIVKTQLRDHVIIDKLLNTTLVLQRSVSNERVTARYLMYKMVLTSIQEEAREMYSALALLHQGIVSTTLVNYTQLESSYTEFKRMALARGMKPVYDSAESLLGEHAAYWVENGNVLRFAIPVPIIPVEAKLLTAYRLESDPTSIPGDDKLQIEFDSVHQYILVNFDRSYYYALTADEWSRCVGPDGRKVCPEVRMRRDLFQNSCIGALFKGLQERRTMCGVKIRRAPAFEVKEVRVGLLRILATEETPIQWRTHCAVGGGTNVTVTRNGTTYLHVPEGCTVYGPAGAYFNPPNTIQTTAKLETVDQHDLMLPPSLAAFDSWKDVRGVLDEHDVHDYVDATKLSEMRERRILKHLHAITGGGGSGYAIVVVVVVVLVCIIAVVAAICTFLMWRRINTARQLAFQTVGELAPLHQSTPMPPQPPQFSSKVPSQASLYQDVSLASQTYQTRSEIEAQASSARALPSLPPQHNTGKGPTPRQGEPDAQEPPVKSGGRRHRKKASWPPQSAELELVDLQSQ